MSPRSFLNDQHRHPAKKIEQRSVEGRKSSIVYRNLLVTQAKKDSNKLCNFPPGAVSDIDIKKLIFLTAYDALSSTEFCRAKRPVVTSFDGSLIGGGGADRRVPLRDKPVGIEGAGRVGRTRPFSEVGVDGCSDKIDVLSTLESSECTLTLESSRYKFYVISSAKKKQKIKNSVKENHKKLKG